LISIIVPVYNSEKLVDKFFEVFLKTPQTTDYELIVVDNFSTDSTYEKVQTYINRVPGLSLFSYKNKQSSYAARNYGVSVSKGEVLAFVDFDCIITEKYLRNIVNYTKNHKSGEIVAGAVELFYIDKNIYEIFDRYANLKQQERVKRNSVLTANLIVYRQDFLKIGGFEEVVSGGDHAFSQMAVVKGLVVNYDESYLVMHPPRATYREHKLKAERVGKGLSQVFAENKASVAVKLLFLFKKLATLFMPLHQLGLAVNIIRENELTGMQKIELTILCYAVGFYSRLSSLKQLFIAK